MQRSVTSIRFLGAARTVTGSRFLVESGGARVLVECGLYQGLREHRRLNWAPFPSSPRGRPSRGAPGPALAPASSK
jgi:metallo-beta-lactamase family protein